MSTWKLYWKTIIAAAIAVLILTVEAIEVALYDDVWSTADSLTVGLAFLNAVATYFKANTNARGENVVDLAKQHEAGFRRV